ncbi:hypothetical protein [Photobacterium leiognathi]|uniref:hypothetical protein n=1 Tax=Photobacterium leiognathi TaxID=553611 RepID=UPI003DA1C5A2
MNFFGFVEIRDEQSHFNETSSREGLIENEAFRQLRNFVHRTLVNGVLIVAAERNVKTKSGQKQDENGNWDKIEVSIKNIAKTIEEMEQEFDDDGVKSKTRRKKKSEEDKRSCRRT